MIKKSISSKILTIGTDFKKPTGGVAFVLNAYSELYAEFNFIKTSRHTNKFNKIGILILAIMRFLYYVIFKGIKIIHIHGSSYNSFYRKRIFVNLSLWFNKRVVYHIHGGESKKFIEKNPSVLKTFSKCHQIIVLSESWKTYFSEILPQKKINIIPNICPFPIIKQRELNDEKLNILFLGSISNSKGLFDLIDLIIEKKYYFNEKVVFNIGGKGESNKLINLIHENNLNNLVTYHGWVDKGAKETLLLKTDIYLLPSYNEGVPISILEAMSYSIPIISTNVGGIPDVVVNNRNGILINPGEKELLFEALKTIIEHNELRKSMGRESLNMVKEHFPDEIGKKLINLYNPLINQNNE